MLVTADNQAVTCGGGVPALFCKHSGPANSGAGAAFTGGLNPAPDETRSFRCWAW